MLDRLRKKDKDWPMVRWMHLFHGTFVICAYSYFYYKFDELMNLMQEGLGDNSLELAFYFAVIATFSALILFHGVFSFISTLIQWHGNWKTKLILKLYDEVDSLSNK